MAKAISKTGNFPVRVFRLVTGLILPWRPGPGAPNGSVTEQDYTMPYQFGSFHGGGSAVPSGGV